MGTPTWKLFVINGMEDAIVPIEDNFIEATRGNNKVFSCTWQPQAHG